MSGRSLPLALLLLFGAAAPSVCVAKYTGAVKDYIDDGGNDPNDTSLLPLAYQKYKKEIADSFKIEGSISASYQQADSRIEVPGFITTTQAQYLGQIIGPSSTSSSPSFFRIGDITYIRWISNPEPKVGEIYNVITNSVVLQSVVNPTDFIVREEQKDPKKYPDNYHLAGYMYETKGKLKVIQVAQGLVTASIQEEKSEILIDDKIMASLPTYSKVTPITGGVQLAAAIVSGSPPERIAVYPRSFVYINRGSRDGMKVGRVFQAVEGVPLNTKQIASPEQSLGELKIIYVSDSYSTAIITKEFDLIRVGALLKTKQEFNPLIPKTPYAEVEEHEPLATPEKEVPTPNEELDKPVPEPQAPAPQKPMSDLDQLEQSERVKGLSNSEKARLDKLADQENKRDQSADAVVVNPDVAVPEVNSLDTDEAPSVPQEQNSFQGNQPKALAKKDTKKKKKKSSDEEELNQLMQQN